LVKNYHAKISIRIVTVLMKENLNDLKNIILFAKEVGVVHVHIKGVNIYDEKLDGSVYDSPSKDEIQKALLDVLAFAKSQNIKVTYISFFRKMRKVKQSFVNFLGLRVL